jgi:hypothetical protein
LLLPERVRVLNAAIAALVGLGVIQRWRDRVPLAVQAMALVGLSWLAGHAAFAEVSRPSLILALSFALAAWGALRAAEGRFGGLWLLDGAQVAVVALLAVLKEPLAAGLVGLLLFGQIALQPALKRLPMLVKSQGEELAPGGDDVPSFSYGDLRALVMRRTWPWLLAAMLVAALAIS